MVLVLVIARLALVWMAGPVDTDDVSLPPPPAASSDPSASGATVPVRSVETTPTESFATLPAGIPLDESSVTENYTSQLGERTQQVVIYTSAQSVPDLYAQYQTWLQESEGGTEFSVDELSPPADGMASVVATQITTGGADEELVIVITRRAQAGPNYVQLDYIHP